MPCMYEVIINTTYHDGRVDGKLILIDTCKKLERRGRNYQFVIHTHRELGIRQKIKVGYPLINHGNLV